MEAITLNNISIEEYIAISQEQDQKYEYHDGHIFAMAGGTLEHSRIKTNVTTQLGSKLLSQSSKCEPFDSDARLHIKKINRIFYPDAMVVCGEVIRSETEKESITNPTVIVEVLSETTESYDRGDKFHCYQQIPGLKEYVLVSQNKMQVDVFKNEGKDLWKIKRYDAKDEVLKIESIAVKIPFDKIYRNVSFAS